MAEKLGDAVLDLRTNDAAFNAGVAQAEGRAQKLGSTLDKTSGSSAKLATEMVATGRSAAQMGAGFEAAGQRVTQSAGQQRAGLQQLSFQLNDAATMFALGARPMQIFASQSGQVIQAVQLMAGGTSRLAAFLGGPWGLAITSAAIVLTPFIGKLFEAETALEGVEFASDKLGEAQGILGSVINSTTGQINAQSQALVVLARAQAAAGRVGALARRADAQRELTDIRRGDLTLQGGFGGGLKLARQGDGTEDVVTGFVNGGVNASFAIGSLESRLKGGQISQEAFLRATKAITDFEVEGANVKVFEDLQRALNGDAGAARALQGPQGGRTRGSRGASGRQGPSQEDIDARFEGDLINVGQQILRARLQVATSSEERAELAARGVEWDRRDALAAIAARDELSAAQRAELAAATNRLADAELEAIAFNERIELARDAQALADERFRGEAEALQNAQSLADTEAERKAIALRLYDAQVEEERIRLQTIISLAAKGEAEAQAARLAQQSLDNLNANAGTGRAVVNRANETETERYLRGLNQTSGQINEALDGIRIDGLEALNDGLVDAITGAESLGDVFSRIADQIIADLLRIAIQQAIIRPLANSLFGGGGGGEGGGGGGLFGSIGSFFAGLFADGGTIPTGQFGIVGEKGPELAFAGKGGLGIMSNADSRAALGGGGGTSVMIPISIDATGADAAALERVRAEISQLRDQLPGQIVSTVQEADNRRILNLRGR